MLDQILPTFSLSKFQIKEKFNKLHSIIHQTLTLKISLRTTKNVLLNHILFLLIMFFLEKIFSTYNKIRTINDQIRDEKLQDDINRKTGEISALSSDKIDKYECLTGKEMLPCNHQQIIAPAKCTYSFLRKAFIKQIKTIEDQGKKQVDALKEEAKVVEEKSGDKLSMQKKIYNRFLKERTS